VASGGTGGASGGGWRAAARRGSIDDDSPSPPSACAGRCLAERPERQRPGRRALHRAHARHQRPSGFRWSARRPACSRSHSAMRRGRDASSARGGAAHERASLIGRPPRPHREGRGDRQTGRTAALATSALVRQARPRVGRAGLPEGFESPKVRPSHPFFIHRHGSGGERGAESERARGACERAERASARACERACERAGAERADASRGARWRRA